MDSVSVKMLSDLLGLLIGLALIIQGGDWFVAAAIRVAEFLRMPRVVIGGTLVSLATTCPELVVSIIASSRGESGLAVGNAVGSCLCNVGLVLGVTAFLRPIQLDPKSLRLPLGAMLVVAMLLFGMTLDLNLARWQGALLVAAGAAYFVGDFIRHYRDRSPAHLAEATAIEEAVIESRWAWFKTRPGTATQFLIGAAVVVGGSRLLVDGAVGAAGKLGISSMVIGLTVVAVGTSLPELITAVTSSRRAVSDLAVGNVLGANIANLSIIVGTAALLSGVPLDRTTQLFNFPSLLVVMGVLGFLIHQSHGITRRGGILLLALYGSYLAALIAITLGQRSN
jgi:cation:H+ antiporter